MAYITGTATSTIDLLDTLQTFLETNGWTTYHAGPDGSGKRLHMVKGDIRVNLRAAKQEKIWPDMRDSGVERYGIGLNCSTGFDNEADWHSQPGAPTDIMNRVVGVGIPLHGDRIPKYVINYLTSPDAVFLSCEMQEGQWVHLAFGALRKIGNWPGGTFFSASRNHYYMYAKAGFTDIDTENQRLFSQETYSNTYVRADIDAFDRMWLSAGERTNAVETGYTGKPIVGALKKLSGLGYSASVPNYALLQCASASDDGRTANTLNCLTINLPLYIYALRDPNAMNEYSLIGYIPHAYYANLKYLAPGGIYEIDHIGGDQYSVFPFSKREGQFGYDGLSVRYIP